MTTEVEPLVQPLVVLKTGSHEETVRVGAQASVAVHERATEQTAYDEWLSGPFTKTVRRAALKDILKLQAWANEQGMESALIEGNDSAALALPPLRYEDFPKALSRLQVSGTNFARLEAFLPHLAADPLQARLLVLDSLTTGKATAQAAHALWVWKLALPKAELEAWHELAMPTELEFTAADELAELAGTDAVHAIRDNGLTEVEAQTLTAVAFKHSA